MKNKYVFDLLRATNPRGGRKVGDPHRWAAVWVALTTVALSSCEEALQPTNPSALQPVAGKVLVDGKPDTGVEVRLYPLNRSNDVDAPHPHGTTDKEGRFQLRTGETGKGAPAGPYLVTLVWPAGRGGADQLGDAFAEPDGSGLTALIDEKTTELPTFEVSAARRRGRR